VQVRFSVRVNVVRGQVTIRISVRIRIRVWIMIMGKVCVLPTLEMYYKDILTILMRKAARGLLHPTTGEINIAIGRHTECPGGSQGDFGDLGEHGGGLVKSEGSASS